MINGIGRVLEEWSGPIHSNLYSFVHRKEVLDKVLNMQIPPPSSVGLRPPKKLDKVETSWRATGRTYRECLDDATAEDIVKRLKMATGAAQPRGEYAVQGSPEAYEFAECGTTGTSP